ncbi:MAG TPA: alginate lyase family protein [Pyrinomonadaceae bacterium]|nr:alginate lyase family protein [Pyrinomonadaceae bacterium]
MVSKTLTKGIRGLLRRRISFGQATREAFRRGRAAARSRRERALLDDLASQSARLRPEFQLAPSDLLKHFRERNSPSFLSGFESPNTIAALHRDLCPHETQQLFESAWTITREHRWVLLGFGEKEFGRSINWHRDPLSGIVWPLEYHADISLWQNEGSDIRVLWELNRLGHLVTLARAYALTKEEQFAVEFFEQVESWGEQNPLGRGANWSCAMEVALRAMNLLAAFSLFRNSPALSEERLLMLLTMFDQHGAHIRRNLEFSYLATSNHYLSDVAGLLWLGLMLPELHEAAEWRAWAFKELLREMDKQVLSDGAHYEGSTGYHRFALELFLYSFILCKANDLSIADKYWHKLHQMLQYLRAILRPDGPAPLVGDTDGGQVLPIVSRNANDHAYLLRLGAAVFKDTQLKPEGMEATPELLWILGDDGLLDYKSLAGAETNGVHSQAFPEAGTYVLRHTDLYLLFNANGAHKRRPLSHQHNDLLSIELSACGRAFIVDPGTYVYTADLHERHLFRSTAYHSTLQIDDAEQRTINEGAPFATGDEAVARVLSWKSAPDRDQAVAEHSGYEHLPNPVIHRRAITFDKANRWWLIEDELIGKGEHKIAVRFHFDAGLDVKPFDSSVVASDVISGVRLVIRPLDSNQNVELEPQFTSRQYGSKVESISACWTLETSVPCKLRWAIIPVCAGDDYNARMTVVQRPMSWDGAE